MEEQIQILQNQIDELRKLYEAHVHSGTDTIKIKYTDIKQNNKQSAITAPTGGGTVDTQARTVIGTIITTLQALNLTN